MYTQKITKYELLQLQEKYGVHESTIRQRMKRGMTLKEALTKKRWAGSGMKPKRLNAIKSKDQKERLCLFCGGLFLSTWIGHRRCQSCNEILSSRYGL